MTQALSRFRGRRAARLQRGVVAVLCAQLLLGACQAKSIELRAGTSGGEPMPPPVQAPRMPSPQWPGAAVARTAPNFQAPSATDCARPIATREILGERERHRTASALPSKRSLRVGEPVGLRESEVHETEKAPSRSAADKPVAESTLAPVMPTQAPVPVPVPKPRAAPAATGNGDRMVEPGAPVTAGMVDDNADFAEYLRFRDRTRVAHRARDVRERYLLQVRDARGIVVPDAEVAVQSPSGAAMWARTDAGGRAWLHPDAFDSAHSSLYEVTVRKEGQQSSAFLRRGQKSAVDVVLADIATPAPARLDLVFLIDATGSMADEIGRLKTTLRSIANEVAQLPSRPDTCFGLVAYRDKGDEFLLRSHDFTNNLAAFQGVLNALQANGGGDYPEAMNEALHETVHRLSWRGSGATRMVVLLADAPPHLDYGGPQYDDDMLAALGKGIKVFSVGASGLDKQGEYVQRQIAQYTGGRFVFLTYKDADRPSSGPGRETVHDVNNYSVQTLDRLIVRLVTEELAKLPKPG